jgi:predicted ArsR family transcriptional regulator
MPDFDRNVDGVSALADPVRRQLYRFVCSQSDPVSREQAAEAVGVALHQAKFHLDRLAAEGLLETDYVRLTGRTGPGAGRPAKRYRRGDAEFAVALPAREYELAGRIMADAITAAARTGELVTDTLRTAAAAHGTAIGREAGGRASSADIAVDLAASLLSEHGYEPRRSGEVLTLANCPFHALARTHTQLVCQMNHALVAGLAESVAGGLLQVDLEPGEHRCCVTLTVRSE